MNENNGEAENEVEELADRISNAFTGSYTYPESGEVSFHLAGSPDDLGYMIMKEVSCLLASKDRLIEEKDAQIQDLEDYIKLAWESLGINPTGRYLSEEIKDKLTEKDKFLYSERARLITELQAHKEGLRVAREALKLVKTSDYSDYDFSEGCFKVHISDKTEFKIEQSLTKLNELIGEKP